MLVFANTGHLRTDKKERNLRTEKEVDQLRTRIKEKGTGRICIPDVPLSESCEKQHLNQTPTLSYEHYILGGTHHVQRESGQTHGRKLQAKTALDRVQVG